MRGTQGLLGQFVDLFLHVVRRQLQPGGDAVVVGQSRLGQALPGSMRATKFIFFKLSQDSINIA